MARVIVAEDVLSAQPEPVREIDVELLVEQDIEESVIDHWLGDVRFLVSPGSGAGSGPIKTQRPTEEQLDSVAAAVRAAAERFWLVEEAGRELPGAWAVPESRTPDVVLGPLRSEAGIVVTAGTKDGVTVPMAKTLVAILRAELEQLDVDTQITPLPDEVDPNHLAPWHDPKPSESTAENPPQPERKFWYVIRHVEETTSRGFRRDVAYYLGPDLEWTLDQAEGASFAEADRASVFRFVEGLRAEAGEMSGVYAVLTAATSHEPRPLRPGAIGKGE
jgi:hypothetical protein